MRFNSIPAGLIAGIAFSVIVSGCAGTVVRPVSEEDRDTSGKYSGWWNARTVETRSPQTFGDWRSNCSDPKVDFAFEVADGQIQLKRGNLSRSAYVDGDGRFRVTFPTEGQSNADVSSTRILKSDTALVLEGVLGDEPPVGRFTVEIVQLGNGCRSSVAFKKLAGKP